MASAAGNERVTGRIDSAGRLIEADAMLSDLQREAGSSVGDRLALPQLAAIARLARKLGVSPATAAGQLSNVLPGLIDYLTPQGQTPAGGLGDTSDLLGLFGGLMQKR